MQHFLEVIYVIRLQINNKFLTLIKVNNNHRTNTVGVRTAHQRDSCM